MEKITIELKDSKARKLIESLEALNLLKIVKDKKKTKGKKLSERLAGSISTVEAKKMHDELEQVRNEWERGI